MSFARYPQYRDSGVEWLGEVPAHWSVDRIKHRCEVFPSNVDKKTHDGEKPVRLCNYTDVYYNDRIVAELDFMEASASDDQIDRFTLKSGDTIITKDSETADDIGISAFVPDDLPGVVCGYHLTMIRPGGDVDGAFVKRLFDAHATKAHLEVSANGLTRVGLGQYALDNLTFAWPPLFEQSAIATFIDRETAKIDALVAEQERLIELLKEKRQAVISHAVTKGLDSSVPMKDSGVEWLGEVPAHWDVSAIKYVAKVGNGSTPHRDTSEYWDGGTFPWLTSSVVNQDRVEIPETFVTQHALASCHLPIVEPPAVLIGITGEGRTRGMATTLMITATINQHVAFVKPSDAVIEVDFLRFYFDMAYARMRFESDGGGSTRGAITCDQISRMRIPLPSVAEQIAITKHVSRAVQAFAQLEQEALGAVTLLQERRSALISAAVTGQIDVRGLACAPDAHDSMAASA